MDWLLLLGVAATWGSLFLFTKKALLIFSAWEVTGLRYVLCLCLLLPFVVRASRSITTQNRTAMLAAAIFGSGLPVLLLTLGQQQINSATTAIINALTPLFGFLLGWSLFGIRPNALQSSGVVAGLCGVMILSFARHGLELSANPMFALFAVSATLCYGWTAHYVKTRLPSVAAIDLTTITFMVTGGASAILLAAWPGVPRQLLTAATPSGCAYLMTMSACSVLAVLGYYELIRRRGALFATTVTYITPIVAFGWGLLDGELLGVLHATALGTILMGVGMANFGRFQGAKTKAAS